MTDIAEADFQSPPAGMIPVLQNLVATVNLGCPLTLQTIASKARNAEYNPKRFAAAIIRIRDPKTTALIFASGKMVVTGAKSEESARNAARLFGKIVQRTGFPVRFQDFKLQNVVGSVDVKFPIRLEGLAFAHAMYCSYEPELFPGLIYRMKAPKVVLLVFVSGKVVLTGGKSQNDICEAFNQIYSVLAQFRKGAAAPHSAPALPLPASAPAPSQAVAEQELGQPVASLPAP